MAVIEVVAVNQAAQLRIVQTACQVDGGVQTAFEGLADGQEVAEDFEVGNVQVKFAAQRGGIEAGALTDVDGTVGTAVIGLEVEVAVDGGRTESAADGGGRVQTACNALGCRRHKGFERAQIGNADIDFAADGGVVDVVAELLGDAERAVNFAEAGVAFQRAVDAAVLETGAQGERGKSQRLFVFRVFARQDDVAALSADVEEAARVLTVRQIPVAAQDEVVFDRRSVEVVQFGNVQILCAAFTGNAGFLVPNEILQVEAAAHSRPSRAAEGNAFAAGFEVEAVLQFEVERAVDVERVNRAFPLGLVFVEAAGGIEVELVAFAVHRHAAVAADVVARACAADEQVDVVDHGRAAGDGDVFAFNIGTQRTVGIWRTLKLEVEGADVDGIGDFEVARFAVQIGFKGFEAV